MKCKFCDGSGKDYWELNGVPYPCPVCNGTGEVQVTGDSVTDICDKCGGTGKITKKDSVTNEEWLEQASTEEKALFLARLYGHSRAIELSEMLFYNVGTRNVADVADYIGKWLKEEHDD